MIIDWAKDPCRGIGPFRSEHMETTHFIDLTARLGQPYVYVHQGDCEHIIILSDLRFVAGHDVFLSILPITVVSDGFCIASNCGQ